MPKPYWAFRPLAASPKATGPTGAGNLVRSVFHQSCPPRRILILSGGVFPSRLLGGQAAFQEPGGCWQPGRRVLDSRPVLFALRMFLLIEYRLRRLVRCAGIRDLGDTDGRRLALRSCSCRMQRPGCHARTRPTCLPAATQLHAHEPIRAASFMQTRVTSTHMSPRASLHGSGVPRCHLRVPKARSAGVANQAQHPLEPDNNFAYIIRTWRELKLVGHFINLSPKQTHTRQQPQPQGPGTLPGMKQ